MVWKLKSFTSSQATVHFFYASPSKLKVRISLFVWCFLSSMGNTCIDILFYPYKKCLGITSASVSRSLLKNIFPVWINFLCVFLEPWSALGVRDQVGHGTQRLPPSGIWRWGHAAPPGTVRRDCCPGQEPTQPLGHRWVHFFIFSLGLSPGSIDTLHFYRGGWYFFAQLSEKNILKVVHVQ